MSPADPPRRVLVVGGSSGIGLATARALHERGDRVALLSRSEPALRAAQDASGAELVLPCDVTDETALIAALDTAVERLGGLDAVVHTAQTMAYGRIEDVPREIYEAVVATAMFGTANLARAVLPRFRAQGHGTLVIVNSLLGEIATPRMGAYDSAKWGQLGLARVLQLETRDEADVHVCIVSPGAIDTPIYDQAANYAGRPGHAPPPVVAPDRVAARILRVLEHPRRHTEVGPANVITRWGFRLLPGVYDRIVGPLVSWAVFRGRPVEDGPGNVLGARPGAEAERGGWGVSGRRRPSDRIER